MLHRHVLEDGSVFYCIIDSLPVECGGGAHVMLASRKEVLESEAFEERPVAERWLAARLASHSCGVNCHRIEST
jgi:hypothetical protein